MKKSREFRLIKNTILYFLGNFASKILNIVLMPLYIIFSEAKDFGEIDFSSIIVVLYTGYD